MSRRRTDLQGIDITLWPTVDTSALSGKVRAIFSNRRRAIELYAAGATTREIKKQTGIDAHPLYHFLGRCLEEGDDGLILGFRGLIRYKHVGTYRRVAKIRAVDVKSGSGLVGAFILLMERYPTLVTWLREQIRDHAVVLHQINTDGRLRTRLQGLGVLHQRFLQQCRSLGITAADYPLNTEHTGIRSLCTYVKAEMLRNFGAAAHAAGARHLKGLPSEDAAVRTDALRPYQVVEFDGHRLDVRLKIVIRDPLGFEQEFEIERIWLLVILDVRTRAVLGYHLVLEREYSRYDVIKTIERALTPHRPRTFTLSQLGYGPGGFPSGKLPELAYATWQWIRLDNAKANLAHDTLTALCEFVGCFADACPPHHPDDRPYIERFFGTVASTLSSRLPGYTGSSPQDLRRQLADPKGNLRLFVSLDELEELMEVSLAAYNATPHAGLNGRSPLEAMEYLVRGKGAMLDWLPEGKRRTLCLMQTAHRCRVRGYLDQGVRPHINLFQVRYTSAVLAASGTLLGKDLRVYYNHDDLRSVRAFLPDGTELGILKAQGAWGEVGHGLKLRREIIKIRGKKRLTFAISQDFINQFVDAKKAKAKTSRRAASNLASTLKVLAQAPTANTPPGPPKRRDQPSAAASEATADVAVPVAPPDKPRIEPEKLFIRSGYAGSI
jgi:putative transposase